MTIYQDQHHDPRTYREPPKGKPGVVKAPELRCARAACETRTDTTYVAPEQLAAFARVHGFVESEGRLFCSKRCSMLHQNAPDTPVNTVKSVNGTDVRTSSRSEVLRAGATPTRVTSVSGFDRDGNPVTWFRCDLWSCETRVEAPSAERAAQCAAQHGFVQNEYGTFCGLNCARKARTEIDAGMQNAAPVDPRACIAQPAQAPAAAPVVTAAPPTPAPEPVPQRAVVPTPAPQPQNRGQRR